MPTEPSKLITSNSNSIKMSKKTLIGTFHFMQIDLRCPHQPIANPAQKNSLIDMPGDQVWNY